MLCGAAGSRELFLSILTISCSCSRERDPLLASILNGDFREGDAVRAGRSRPSARAGSARTLTVAEPEPGTVLDAAGAGGLEPVEKSEMKYAPEPRFRGRSRLRGRSSRCGNLLHNHAARARVLGVVAALTGLRRCDRTLDHLVVPASEDRDQRHRTADRTVRLCGRPAGVGSHADGRLLSGQDSCLPHGAIGVVKSPVSGKPASRASPNTGT